MKYNIERYRRELISLGVIFLLLTGGAVAGVWKQNREPLIFLERPEWGLGEREESFTVEKENGERQEIKVTVKEKKYTEAEIRDFFRKAENFIRTQTLGENEGWDRIRGNLTLAAGVPGLPVEIYWDMGEEEYFDRQGSLLLERVPLEGGSTELMAVLLCQGERKDVEIPVKILPPVWTKEELWQRSVEERIQKEEEKLLGEEKVQLPAWIDGQRVAYYQENGGKAKGKEWLLFSLAAGTLLYAGMKREEKEKRENRKRKLLAEYPVLTEKLLLFMGAGVSLRNIFFKLGKEDKNRAYGKELKRACQELKNGETEGEVYLHFGERIGLLPYIRLGALLSQNLRSGTKEIMGFLERERKESFYERKEKAKQKGEEIGVKLLLPMGILLFLTMAVIMIPAFLQF